MNATHQMIAPPHSDAVAWRNVKGNWIPVWVARNFHDLGGHDMGEPGTLAHRSGEQCAPGDWIVTDPEAKVAYVFKDQEFSGLFRELPPVVKAKAASWR